MSLSPEMVEFYQSWSRKADAYTGRDVSDYYNKAFTLFTLYNRLYGEATFTLAREGKITLQNNRPFPDSKGAKKYGPQFVGCRELLNAISNNQACNDALNELIQLLENERFYIKLSMPEGNRQPDKDQKLLRELKSTGTTTKVTAILDLIYSVRCNMFHGNKGFNPIQVELLEPVTIILKKIIELLYLKLTNHHN